MGKSFSSSGSALWSDRKRKNRSLYEADRNDTSGEDEESIKKDAEAMAKLFAGRRQPTPPLADPEAGAASKNAAMKKLLTGLTGKGE